MTIFAFAWRASVAAVRKHPLPVARWGSVCLIALCAVVTAMLFSPGVVAKSRDNSWQADFERQRKEYERAQQAAIKAAQEAQKAAERAAQKMQAELERQQRIAQERAMREAEKARQAAIKEAERAAQQAAREAKQQQQQQLAIQKANALAAQKAAASQSSSASIRATQPQQQQQQGDSGSGSNVPSSNKAVREADIDDGMDNGDSDLDDFDPDLNDAQRHVREMEKAHQRELMRAAQQQQARLRREAERAQRIRERSINRPDLKPPPPAPPPIPVKALPKPDSAPPPPRVTGNDTQAKPVPVALPGDGVKTEDLSSRVARRRDKWLDEYQRRSSGLGMGPGAIKGTLDPKGGADKADGATAAPDAGGHGPANPATDRGPGRRDADKATGANDVAMPSPGGTFAGKDRGAEMPPEVFEKAREEELLVTEISPADVEKAKEHGFVLDTPTVLNGTGTKVQRLRGPTGFNRDEAERELHKVLPFVSVTPNFAYNIFVGSLGETDSAAGLGPGIDRRKVAPASPEPCPHNTCFGSDLIKWKSTLGSCAKGVRIGVIDTSFDLNHPALKNIKAEQGEFLDGQQPSPYDWHGTAVLSLLAGDPGSGTPGLVPDATFLLATAFRSDAAGNASTDTVRLLAALSWLEQLDVDIVNMSFSGPQDPAFSRAIERMSKKGVVFIAAAGNMGPTAAPSYPAAYPSVVAVTAVNRNGDNYRSANRGNYIDVSAPGVDILTALPEAKQGYRTGTSFAVPFVTAIFATRGGDATAAGAKAQLLQQVSTRDLGPPGRDPIYGSGLALAPQRCQGGAGAVARNVPAVPSHDSWSTTFVRAGAAP